MRVPAERIGDLMPLAGKAMDVGGRSVMLGVPTVFPLSPSPVLDARMLILKITEPDLGTANGAGLEPLRQRYRAEVERQLSKLEIRKPFELLGTARLTVSERTLVGFAARVSDLSEVESIRLMEHGLGGRRRMGAGVFRPTRGGVPRG